MSQKNFTLSTWQRLSTKPLGKWTFSRLVCWKAPYFSSIRPRFVELRPGYCEVRIEKRHRVLNHIGTVHAIAMCNAAELAGGTMTDVSVPVDCRWIPKGMTVEYLAKAETALKAIANFPAERDFASAAEVPVDVTVFDTADQVVFRAVTTMWVSPRTTE